MPILYILFDESQGKSTVLTNKKMTKKVKQFSNKLVIIKFLTCVIYLSIFCTNCTDSVVLGQVDCFSLFL